MTRPALIIGAGGQDGSLLAERLVAAGLPVVGIVRPGAAPIATAPCELRAIDVTDPPAVAALIAELRPSRVFYLAAVHHSAEGGPDDRYALWPAMLQGQFRRLGPYRARRAPARARLPADPGRIEPDVCGSR
ncbi:MAG: NAD-dependent epimerase/dehydratase family protein [Pseudomonadota bacterium]